MKSGLFHCKHKGLGTSQEPSQYHTFHRYHSRDSKKLLYLNVYGRLATVSERKRNRCKDRNFYKERNRNGERQRTQLERFVSVSALAVSLALHRMHVRLRGFPRRSTRSNHGYNSLYYSRLCKRCHISNALVFPFSDLSQNPPHNLT